MYDNGETTTDGNLVACQCVIEGMGGQSRRYINGSQLSTDKSRSHHMKFGRAKDGRTVKWNYGFRIFVYIQVINMPYTTFPPDIKDIDLRRGPFPYSSKISAGSTQYYQEQFPPAQAPTMGSILVRRSPALSLPLKRNRSRSRS